MAHNQMYQPCIDACLRCASICNHCASACLQEEDIKMLVRCIHLDIQCAIVCNAAGQLMSFGREHASHLCGECAEICDACAEECENMRSMAWSIAESVQRLAAGVLKNAEKWLEQQPKKNSTMAMTSRLSKLVFTSHIIFSVSWLGAVAVFLALAVTGLTTRNMQLAHSTYVAMEVSTLFVIVPFCLASFLTGLLQALGTKWGLFKYYWIVVKLFLTLAMTALLLLHLQPISYLAGVASDTNQSNTNQAVLVIDLIKKAAAAILVLIAITTISIYKPWGKIEYRQYSNGQQKKKKSASFYLLIALIGLIILFLVIHLLSGGIGNH